MVEHLPRDIIDIIPHFLLFVANNVPLNNKSPNHTHNTIDNKGKNFHNIFSLNGINDNHSNNNIYEQYPYFQKQ